MGLNAQGTSIKRQFPALAAALAISLAVGAVMVALGVNALANSNSTPLKAAPSVSAAANGDQATIQRLQSDISVYQAREQQYQSELNQAAQQLNQAQTQIQQYRSLVNALQDAGVIQITQNGQVFLSGGPGVRFGSSNGG